MTQRIVINKCFGGFGLSDEAYRRLIDLGMQATTWQKAEDGRDSYANADADIVDWQASEEPPSYLTYSFMGNDEEPAIRTHPLILQVVEELGERANGSCAELEIIEIPDGVDWHIAEYDGIESVSENHRSWP